jgi:hypothetical protein
MTIVSTRFVASRHNVEESRAPACEIVQASTNTIVQ